MSEPIRIRDAERSDITAIADIYNESLMAGDCSLDEVLKTPEDILAWMDSFTERELFIVMEEGSEIIGMGIIRRYSDKPGYRFCAETTVFLRRTHLRRGLGTRMKTAVIERCKALGYHHLIARIFASNTASIEYNKRLGYELVGTMREIGYKNGQWIDVAFMQLVLDDIGADESIPPF